MKIDGKYGTIDKTGRYVIPVRFDALWFFSEDLGRIKLSGKYGFINMNGDIVIPCQYDEAWAFVDGLARVRLNGRWGYIDNTGKWFETKKEGTSWINQQDVY